MSFRLACLDWLFTAALVVALGACGGGSGQRDAGGGGMLDAGGGGGHRDAAGGGMADAAKAAKLAFTVPPSSATAGAAIAPAVQVAFEDSSGNVVTSASGAVTVALDTHGGPGTLAGTLTANAVAGVATFDDLSIDKVGTGYTLAATAAGYTGDTSDPFDVTAGAADSAASTLVASPAAVAADGTTTPCARGREPASGRCCRHRVQVVPTRSHTSLAVVAPGAVGGCSTPLAPMRHGEVISSQAWGCGRRCSSSRSCSPSSQEGIV